MGRRYELLDGLRGLAALAVLAHHMVRHLHDAPFTRAYLAVDFFFLLSGFVIAAAYGERLTGRLSFREYAQIRLARLYPMILLGALLGAVAALFRGAETQLAWVLLMQLLFVPFQGDPTRAYVLNNVQWSLFFEIFVNLLHAAFARLLTTPVLAAVAALSGAALVATDVYFGSLGVGWSRDNFWGGFPRVIFSFALGLLLYRAHEAGRLAPVPLAWLVTPLALLLLLAAPPIRQLPDSVFVIGFFPVLVALGAVATAPAWARRLALLSGAISYPLYAIHIPLLEIADRWAPKAASAEVRMAYQLATAITIVLIAWALERCYERPLRRLLMRVGALARSFRLEPRVDPGAGAP